MRYRETNSHGGDKPNKSTGVRHIAVSRNPDKSAYFKVTISFYDDDGKRHQVRWTCPKVSSMENVVKIVTGLIDSVESGKVKTPEGLDACKSFAINWLRTEAVNGHDRAQLRDELMKRTSFAYMKCATCRHFDSSRSGKTGKCSCKSQWRISQKKHLCGTIKTPDKSGCSMWSPSNQ